MADKKNEKITKAGAVELEETELEQVTGGVAGFKAIDGLGIKPRLTETAGTRADKKVGVRPSGIRAIEGSKLRN